MRINKYGTSGFGVQRFLKKTGFANNTTDGKMSNFYDTADPWLAVGDDDDGGKSTSTTFPIETPLLKLAFQDLGVFIPAKGKSLQGFCASKVYKSRLKELKNAARCQKKHEKE